VPGIKAVLSNYSLFGGGRGVHRGEKCPKVPKLSLLNVSRALKPRAEAVAGGGEWGVNSGTY